MQVSGQRDDVRTTLIDEVSGGLSTARPRPNPVTRARQRGAINKDAVVGQDEGERAATRRGRESERERARAC